MLAVLQGIAILAEIPTARAQSAYKVENDLAIGVSLELGRLLQVLAQSSVVVDLSIDSEESLAIVRGQWLSTCVDTDDS